MSHRSIVIVLIGLGILTFLSGCGRTPTIVPVQGTVLLNGKPLPKAAVQFLPQRNDLGSEFISTAVTDENGQFTLTCAYNSRSGAVVGKQAVLISESPLPENLRNSRNRGAVERYRAELGNRPIPPQYNSVSESPIKIEIKEGQEPLTIELTR